MRFKSILTELTGKVKPLLMGTEDVSIKNAAEENPDSESEKVSDKKISTKDVVGAVFNGLGVGLLLGLLLGLAVSPVVSAFIGSLSSVLVLLLGLNEKLFTVVKSIRIGSFGVFAVAGILLGLYIRSHSPLAPSLSELKKEYISLGYGDSIAKEILLFQEFNVIPKDWMGRIVVPKRKADSTKAGDTENDGSQMMMAQNVNTAKRNNVLFSSSVNIGDCYQLESSNEEMSFEIVSFNFMGIGGTWKELAENIDPSIPNEVKTKTLLIVRDVLCAKKGEKTIKINCPAFEKPAGQLQADELKNLLSQADNTWKQITDEINAHTDQNWHKKIYLSLINTFCHD